MLREYKFDGIDLDIEEKMSLMDVKFLISKLKQHMGKHFIITLAPVYTPMVNEIPSQRRYYRREAKKKLKKPVWDITDMAIWR